MCGYVRVVNTNRFILYFATYDNRDDEQQRQQREEESMDWLGVGLCRHGGVVFHCKPILPR